MADTMDFHSASPCKTILRRLSLVVP